MFCILYCIVHDNIPRNPVKPLNANPAAVNANPPTVNARFLVPACIIVLTPNNPIAAKLPIPCIHATRLARVLGGRYNVSIKPGTAAIMYNRTFCNQCTDMIY